MRTRIASILFPLACNTLLAAELLPTTQSDDSSSKGSGQVPVRAEAQNAKPRLLLLNAKLELQDCREVDKLFAALKQNPELQQIFNIELQHPRQQDLPELRPAIWQLPMILLCDSQGRCFDYVCYFSGMSPEELLVVLREKNARLQQRDTLWQQAGQLQGGKRAELLSQGLALLPLVFYQFYPEQLEQLQQADPQDLSRVRLALQQHEALRRSIAKAAGHAAANNQAEVQLIARQFLAQNALCAEVRQAALMFFEINPLLGAEQPQQLQQRLQQIRALDEHSHLSTQISQLQKLLGQP